MQSWHAIKDVHAFFEDCLFTSSLPNTPRSQLIISETNQSFEGAGLSPIVELSKTKRWWGYDFYAPLIDVAISSMFPLSSVLVIELLFVHVDKRHVFGVFFYHCNLNCFMYKQN